jgi:hypothetical protein
LEDVIQAIAMPSTTRRPSALHLPKTSKSGTTSTIALLEMLLNIEPYFDYLAIFHDEVLAFHGRFASQLRVGRRSGSLRCLPALVNLPGASLVRANITIPFSVFAQV